MHCASPAQSVVWRGWLRLAGGHRIELSLHAASVPTLLVVMVSLAGLILPRLFPGWPVEAYWLVAFAVVLADLFAGLLHEVGHALAAIGKGDRVYRITLYGLAAAARRSCDAARPRDQLAIAIAGPLSHLLVASLLWTAWNWLPDDNLPLRVATGFPALSNFSVGLLNLLPVLPLDGGRAARALIAAVVRI